MPRSSICPGLALWLPLILAPVAGAGDPAPPIELRDGDRVVLVGSTLIEREAESGYLETRLARRYPGRSIVVRNLGWSGDTVGGIARARPNPPVDGFRALVDHVVALKPTVVVVGYGSNESFAGPAGLPGFAAGLDRLWAELGKTGARIVVVTPPRQADLGRPWPDPAAHNADLARYGDLLKLEAARRGAESVDLLDALPAAGPWTTNGIHLTPAGYWLASAPIARALAGPAEPAPVLAIDAGKPTATAGAAGAVLSGPTSTPGGLTFRVLFDLLPAPICPVADGPADPTTARRRLRVAGLAPGRYELRVDGQPVIAAPAADWEGGVAITSDPEAAQVEALRARIVRKDLLYFHRWRPQNETYLFGMRKHEQGRNAAELAAFDPQIAAEEAEIARLSRPVPHTYELVRMPAAEVAR